jgi:CubicO group peptidase (beta-lactamase class C family)
MIERVWAGHRWNGVRLRLAAAVLLLCTASCSHAPPPAETAKSDRREDWLLALRSDLERIGANDGFEGQVRVLHGGKPEIDRSFGDVRCAPLGAGRRVLATLAVAILVEAGKLGFEDRVDRHLRSLANGSLGQLTIASLLTDSAGLAIAPGDSLAERLEAAGKVPLQAAPGTRVDPDDDRPWLLMERLVSEVSGEPFELFALERVVTPAGMSGTSLAAAPTCPEAALGTTTLEDQLKLVEALRGGKLVSPATRDALWMPRLPLGPGSDVAYGFFVRTRGDQRAVGVTSVGPSPAYDLWFDPAGADALVLLGRTPAKTARNIRTALGEFYALPPGPPHSGSPSRRPPSH